MKSFATATLVASVGAVVTETKAHKQTLIAGKTARSLIFETLQEAHPNATVMLRKGDDFDVDAWEAYQNKYRVAQDPGSAMISEGSMPVTGVAGAWDGLGGKYLTPGPLGSFASAMNTQCHKLDPATYKFEESHRTLSQPYHSDFLKGWGLSAAIEQSYGHLIIDDQLIMLTQSCTNVVKQTAAYGYAENQCCETATKMCCAAHTNYEVFRHQLGYRYAYVCQGLVGFPFGTKEVTMDQCFAEGDKNWVKAKNAADDAN